MRAVEHDDPGLGERTRQVGGPVGLPVVVAEHRDDRHREIAARIRDDAHLVDLPVLRQVTREQDQVGLLLDPLNASRTRSRSAAPAWMSPAAATRMVFAMIRSYPDSHLPLTGTDARCRATEPSATSWMR